MNGDGKLDLVVTNQYGNCVDVLLGNGNGTFQAQQTFAAGFQPYSVVIGDVSGDGKADIAVADNGSVVAADNGNSAISVLLGNGNGTFQAPQSFAAGPNPDSLVIGDMNGDAKADLAVANRASDTISVLLGNGNGTFQAPQTFAAGPSPGALVIGDVNSDGKVDLAEANNGSPYLGDNNSVGVLLGNGNGTFQAPKTFAVQAFTAFFPACWQLAT